VGVGAIDVTVLLAEGGTVFELFALELAALGVADAATAFQIATNLAATVVCAGHIAFVAPLAGAGFSRRAVAFAIAGGEQSDER
jgi:hypothetical protein